MPVPFLRTPDGFAPVHGPQRAICPCCHRAPEQFTFEDGDSVPHDIDSGRFDAALMWWTCALCRERSYELEIAIASAAPDGAHLMNDFCWEAQGKALYRTLPGRRGCLLTHAYNVREVSFCKADGVTPIITNCAWLDVYNFDFFAEQPDRPAWEFARDICHGVANNLLGIRW